MGCRDDLRPVAPGEATTNDIIFETRGRVALVADTPVSREMAESLLGSQGIELLVIAAPDAAALDLPEKAGSNYAAARNDAPASVEGWLGAFRVSFADGDVVDVDVVIDHRSSPLIDRFVPPYGYITTGADPDGFRDAIAAVSRLRGLFAKPRYFSYDMTICAHESHGQTGCTRCLDVCEADAIRSIGTMIEVEPHLCKGCSACMLACPTGALSPALPPRSDVYARMRAALVPGEAISVGSATEAAIDLDVPVPAVFGEELWLSALAEGAGGVSLRVPPTMPDRALALVNDRIATADAIAQAFGMPAGTVRAQAAQEPDVAESAEAMSGDGADGGEAGAQVPMPVDQRKRDFVNRALGMLEDRYGPADAPLPTGGCLGTIEVDPDACVMCGICAQTCPANALNFKEDVAQARLLFAEGNCVQCGLCARLCPEKAISLHPRIAPEAQRMAWQPANTAPVASCIDCGVPLMPEPLLASMLSRAAQTMPAETHDQFRRCTECRHKRITRTF